MSNKKKTLVLEFDDLHWSGAEDCLNNIAYLVAKVPDIKMSFFTIPFLRLQELRENEMWCWHIREYIKSNNIRLAVHGLVHTSEEFKHVSYDTAYDNLNIAEKIFEAADLPVSYVFRGPHWGMNEDTLLALEDRGYTHLYNHKDYSHLKSDILDVIYYNWNLKDSAPDDDLLIAHGHTHNVCGNGIQESTDKILAYIEKEKPEFKFVDEI